jgi:hypothetical protein
MIQAIGIASIAFVALFTVWAGIRSSRHGGQSMRGSICEAWANIVLGFGINFAANLVVLRLAGFDVTAGGAFWIGCVFTAISIVRSFGLRRAFNYWHHTGVFK